MSGAFCMPGKDAMRPSQLYPEDLVYGHEAAQATGVPEPVIRKWASRGKIQRFTGDGRPNGQGHAHRTMYALPEIQQQAETYKATPQRAPKAA